MKNTIPVAKEQLNAIHVQQYSGPLPHPEALERYEQIVPGAAERIISMAEKEMEHRHKNEMMLSRNVVRTTFTSIVFAFISVLILSGLVFFSLYKGYDKVGASIAVGAISAVAGVFIFFKSKRKE